MIDPLRQSTGTSDRARLRGHDGRLLERAVRHAARPRRDRRGRRTGSTRTRSARCARSSTACTGRASCSTASSLPPVRGTRTTSCATRWSTPGTRPREMVEAIEIGGHDAAVELLFEWRGALFRVRLARMRLGVQPEPEPVRRAAGRTRQPPRAGSPSSARSPSSPVRCADPLAALGGRPRARRRRGCSCSAANEQPPGRCGSARASRRGRAARCSRTGRARRSSR